MDILGTLATIWETSGIAQIINGFFEGGILQVLMIVLSCVLLYLGIVKKFEPLLLVGIAFGMLLTNLPLSGVYTPSFWQTAGDIDYA